MPFLSFFTIFSSLYTMTSIQLNTLFSLVALIAHGVHMVHTAAVQCSNTMKIVTNNNCDVDRTMRWSGPYDSTLLNTTTIKAKQSYTQYIAKNQQSLAWILGDPAQNKFDEVEASMSDGIFFYDVSYIQSYTGYALHVRPILAAGQSLTDACAVIGCDANASLATCPKVYWSDNMGNPDFACQYTQVIGFEFDMCG